MLPVRHDECLVAASLAAGADTTHTRLAVMTKTAVAAILGRPRGAQIGASVVPLIVVIVIGELGGPLACHIQIYGVVSRVTHAVQADVEIAVAEMAGCFARRPVREYSIGIVVQDRPALSASV